MASFKDALVRTNSKPLDIKKFIPQSMYYGTADFYKEKLGEKLLTDEQFEILELETQLNKRNLEINQDHLNYINDLKEQTIQEFNRIMNEFKEREEEGKNDLPLENLNINQENYFIAK